jgi:signal transduction histidine kinase
MTEYQPVNSVGEAECASIEDSQPELTAYLDQRSYRLRYQELFDFAFDAQLVTDARGVILEANHAASAMFRCDKAFLIDKPLGVIVSDGFQKGFYQSLIRVVRLGGSEEFESRIGRGVGCRDVSMRVIALRNAPEYAATLRWHIRDVTDRNQAEDARAELLIRLVTLQEEERRRISREIHDQLGQELTALTLGLKALESDLPDGTRGRRRLRELQEAVDRLGRRAHEMAFELRPTALDDLGLRAALEDLIGRWSERSGVAAGFHFACGGSSRFAPDVESAVYRLVQEALTNVAKHAKASEVSVIIEYRARYLIVLVEDNGQGFRPDERDRSGRLGFLGLHERMSMLGGSLQVESSPGAGTTVRARIPCRQENEATH